MTKTTAQRAATLLLAFVGLKPSHANQSVSSSDPELAGRTLSFAPETLLGQKPRIAHR